MLLTVLHYRQHLGASGVLSSLILRLQTCMKTMGCKSSVRYKVHKNVDRQFEPSLDLDVHREELRSGPMTPTTPRHTRTLLTIRRTLRRMHTHCDGTCP